MTFFVSITRRNKFCHGLKMPRRAHVFLICIAGLRRTLPVALSRLCKAKPWAAVVRGVIAACRIEAREPAGVGLGSGGDAV